jgi:UDP-2,4-diacetamido-2,4,6-trideoxy-beta-L-altropyranose hydrolase
MSGGGANGYPRVLFRADASPRMGAGHVMRCLALADRLAAGGAKICFACAALPEDLAERITRAGHKLLRLEAAGPPEEKRGWDRRAFGRHEQLVDAEATCRAVAAWSPAWIVLDHYRLDAQWEAAVKQRTGARILVLDDLANRPHHCDVLVDQTFGRLPADYAGLVPAGCRTYTGSLYALLRPEFEQARPAALARRREPGRVGTILVSLGATDIDGVTAKAVRAVLGAALGCHIHVVLGPGAPSLPELEGLSRSDVEIHVDSRNMAGLMAAADLAIGAAGGSAWERCCLGLPTVMLALADNQRLIADGLSSIGAGAAVSAIDGIEAAVAELAGNEAARQRMTAAAAAVIDGQGARRVAELLGNDGAPPSSGIGAAELAFRAAADDDAERLWLWRNDPATRAMSQGKDPISWADHMAWFDRAVVSERSCLLIAEAGGAPLGVVRFDRLDGPEPAYEVSINIRPDGRAGGAGGAVLEGGCSYFLGVNGPARLEASISDSNPASRRIFERLGFERRQALGEGGFARYVRR